MTTDITYLVRRDTEKPFSPGNWYIFTESEFKDFSKTEEYKKVPRYFAKEEAIEGGGGIIYTECGREVYLELEKKRSERRYKKTQEKKYGITIESLEELLENSTVTFPTLESAEDEFLKIELARAVLELTDNLPPVSKEVLRVRYLRDTPLSERKCARILRVSKSTVRNRIDSSLETLKAGLSDWWDA